MSTIDEILKADVDWLDALPPRDAREIRAVLEYEPDPLHAAGIWVNSKFGVAGSAPSGEGPRISRQAQSFLDHVQNEVHDALCSPDRYQSERAELVRKWDDSRTAVVAYLSASVSPYLGGGATLIMPVVALTFTIIGRVGLRAWCAMQSERRRTQTSET